MESGEVMTLVWTWGRRGVLVGWLEVVLSRNMCWSLIWALLKLNLLNHGENRFMLAHTLPTPTNAANAHTCTSAAQRRNLPTSANVRFKYVDNVCVSLLHQSLEFITVVTR